jgi:helix-turn-helix protein
MEKVAVEYSVLELLKEIEMNQHVLYINGYGSLIQWQVLKFDTIRQQEYYVTKDLLKIGKLRKLVRNGEIPEYAVKRLYEHLTNDSSSSLTAGQMLDMIEEYL